MRQKKAFTLAEVLITLGIIGVVAAMTIPTLMHDIQEQQTISMLKKEYSVLSQAYKMAVQDNGTPDNWITSSTQFDPASTMAILNNFAPYLRITKNCGQSTGCLPSSPYVGLNGVLNDLDSMSDAAKIQLSDGTIVIFRSWGYSDPNKNLGSTPALQNVVGIIWVDVNGLKGPNVNGKDLFRFYITTYGIIPSGTQPEIGSSFDNACKNSTNSSGTSCTAWVIYNENMDYLKCSNLSWSGPTKCQ